MVRAFVLHWDPPTLGDATSAVTAAGAEVVGSEANDGRAAHDALHRLDPDLVVAWLAWKPSHTRLTLAAMRSAGWGRRATFLLIDDPAIPAPAALLRQLRDALPDAIVDTPARLPFWVAKVAAIPRAATPSA